MTETKENEYTYKIYEEIDDLLIDDDAYTIFIYAYHRELSKISTIVDIDTITFDGE